MNKLLALTIGEQEIEAPVGIPQGGFDTAQGIFQNTVTLLFVVAIILALFFMIWGGIRWLTSQGDKAKVDTARKTIVFAILGLILLFLSYFIINLITDFFAVPRVGVR